MNPKERPKPRSGDKPRSNIKSSSNVKSSYQKTSRKDNDSLLSSSQDTSSITKRKGWGSVARKGAIVAKFGPSQNPRTYDQEFTKPVFEEPKDQIVRVYQNKEVVRKKKSSASKRPSYKLPDDVVQEIKNEVLPKDANAIKRKLAEAVDAYDHDRYQESLKILKELTRRLPRSLTVKELNGLTLYRMGRWKLAIKELEAFSEATGSFDQFPVIADSYRAIGNYEKVEELWVELKETSPSAEVILEGRLVTAAARAEQGDLKSAVELLEKASKSIKRFRPYHLRLWYVLADLYERSGDPIRARETFLKILDKDPMFFDAKQRVDSL